MPSVQGQWTYEGLGLRIVCGGYWAQETKSKGRRHFSHSHHKGEQQCLGAGKTHREAVRAEATSLGWVPIPSGAQCRATIQSHSKTGAPPSTGPYHQSILASLAENEAPGLTLAQPVLSQCKPVLVCLSCVLNHMYTPTHVYLGKLV